jgi:hypothetical protein
MECGENLAVVTVDPVTTHGKSSDAGEAHQRKEGKHVTAGPGNFVNV